MQNYVAILVRQRSTKPILELVNGFRDADDWLFAIALKFSHAFNAIAVLCQVGILIQIGNIFLNEICDVFSLDRKLSEAVLFPEEAGDQSFKHRVKLRCLIVRPRSKPVQIVRHLLPVTSP